jgi:hypothetical protein
MDGTVHPHTHFADMRILVMLGSFVVCHVSILFSAALNSGGRPIKTQNVLPFGALWPVLLDMVYRMITIAVSDGGVNVELASRYGGSTLCCII